MTSIRHLCSRSTIVNHRPRLFKDIDAECAKTIGYYDKYIEKCCEDGVKLNQFVSKTLFNFSQLFEYDLKMNKQVLNIQE